MDQRYIGPLLIITIGGYDADRQLLLDIEPGTLNLQVYPLEPYPADIKQQEKEEEEVNDYL